jgi:hypothetical protein
MANYPDKAVKKFTKPSHREIAAGILIAYGLFPRTNEGIAAAQRLIASRDTWLAPSNLPNYYNDIESDLMTGRETAGIIYIRNSLKEFYGLTEGKTNEKKLNINTGKTTVYKPEDKFVDDITEELDQKLQDTSDQLMDAVDALIEKQKKDFEDFKRKQEEERKLSKPKENVVEDPWTSTVTPTLDFGPISPTPIDNVPDPWQGSATVPPKMKPTVVESDEWESEVPDQLGTKLDELIEQVKNDPLPKPAGDRRRRTKGKTVKRSQPRYSEMHVGSPLAEVMDNVIEAKNALLDLYKITKKHFEFKKGIDKTLTQRLSAKKREQQLEKPTSPDGDTKVKDKDKKESKIEKTLKGALNAGLITAAIGILTPLMMSTLSPFLKNQNDIEPESDPSLDKKAPEDSEETPPPAPVLPPEGEGLTPPPAPVLPPEGEGLTPPPAPVLPPPEGAKRESPQPLVGAPPAPVLPSPITIQPAAEGRKFDKKKSEPLKPLNISVSKTGKNDELSKAIKPLIAAVQLPVKVGAGAMLSFAHSIVNPFSMFMPPFVKNFINNIFKNISDSAGLSGLNFQLSGDSFIDTLKKALEGAFSGGGGGGNGGGGTPPPDNTPNNFSGSTGQDQAMNFFMGKGLTSAQSAGIVGNLMQESGSGIDPKARNSQGNRGIAQWDANRWAGFENFANQKKLDVNTREAQLQWIWEEMRTGSGGLGIDRFKSSAKTSDQAAGLFLTDFERSGERPGSHGYDVRLKNAKALLSKYNVARPTTAGTPPITGTPKQQFEASVNQLLGIPPQAPTMPSMPSLTGGSSRSSTANLFTLQPTP